VSYQRLHQYTPYRSTTILCGTVLAQQGFNSAKYSTSPVIPLRVAIPLYPKPLHCFKFVKFPACVQQILVFCQAPRYCSTSCLCLVDVQNKKKNGILLLLKSSCLKWLLLLCLLLQLQPQLLVPYLLESLSRKQILLCIFA